METICQSIHPSGSVAHIVKDIVFEINRLTASGAMELTAILRGILGYADNEQQDSHEALLVLLGLVVSNASDYVGVDQYTTGQCITCGHQSQLGNLVTELFLPLSLPRTATSITSLINQLSTPYRLNDYVCPQCSSIGTSDATVSVVNPRRFVGIQLKRFAYRTGVYDKHATPIRGCLEIQLENQWYKLIAVIIHIGKTGGSGHYITLRFESNTCIDWTMQKRYERKLDSLS